MRVKYKIPWWKYLLSYFIEIELEKVSSEISGDLSVCISEGRLQLNAKKAIYSWEDKYDNFSKAFDYIFQGKDKDLGRGPKEDVFSLLILGYGMGSIPYMLEKNYKKRFECTGIELDDNVIYLANRYADYGLKSGVQIIQASADLFVEITEQTYEMICVDVFVQDKIPSQFLSDEFLQNLDSIMVSGGYVLFNHLSNKEKEKDFAENYYNSIFKKQFPVSRLLDVGGNYMMIGKKS